MKSVNFFVQKNYPVVIIRDVEAGGPGTEGFECIDELLTSEKSFLKIKAFAMHFGKQNWIIY